jgi:hypothetical protein
MSQAAATTEAEDSLETVLEPDVIPLQQPKEPDAAPVIFKDSFGPMGKDGQRASIAVSDYSRELRRPSEPPRRQSLIQFNTARAEDTIRRESVATGKMPSIEATKMSVGERRAPEGGRRMSSPPPKRYVVFFNLEHFLAAYIWPDYDKDHPSEIP